MKKIIALILIIFFFLPGTGFAETKLSKPSSPTIKEGSDSAVLSWENPVDPVFSHIIIFRSTIPIASYFTYEAVDGLCDKIYEGTNETFTDTGLAANLLYYYIIFARDRAGNSSDAIVLEKKIIKESKPDTIVSTTETNKTLAGASSATVNQIAANEAGIVYNFNKPIEAEINSDSKRLALFIIVKSPHDLSDNDKNAISYFIHTGTPTTIFLGTGERAGVLNSYLSVFSKLPRNTLEWEDVIKISTGRWPYEKNIEAEQKASDVFFSTIYERKPDMNNPKDNAAVTVIAYGLRPANRNMESEKKAIEIYRSIFKKSPTEAADWDLVRAIAYSGATR